MGGGHTTRARRARWSRARLALEDASRHDLLETRESLDRLARNLLLGEPQGGGHLVLGELTKEQQIDQLALEGRQDVERVVERNAILDR